MSARLGSRARNAVSHGRLADITGSQEGNLHMATLTTDERAALAAFEEFRGYIEERFWGNDRMIGGLTEVYLENARLPIPVLDVLELAGI